MSGDAPKDKLDLMRTVYARTTGGTWYVDNGTGVIEIWSETHGDDTLIVGNAAGGYFDPKYADAEMIIFSHRYGPKMETALREIHDWVKSGAGESSIDYKLAKVAVSDILERRLGGAS